MKKLLLSLSVLTALAANAQYTIMSSSSPAVGDVDASMPTSTTGLSMPSSGTNQTWNYTNITVSSTAAVSSVTYVPISSVPNNTLFPGATIGTSDGMGGYEVYKYNSTIGEYLGSAAATPSNCTPFSNPATYITFPFTYGSSFNDTYAASSSQATITANSASSGDGTGTLAVPGYTFTNVLKIATSFTQNVNYSGFLFITKGVNHSFYSAVSKFPLLSITTQTQAVSGSTTVSTSANINKTYAVVGINESSLNTHFNVFPNPVTGGNVNINFTNESSNSMSITLVSVLGQVIKETSFDNIVYGDNNLSLDVKNVTPGIYYLKIKTGSTESVKKLIIE